MIKASSGWLSIVKKTRKRRTPTQRLQDMKQCALDLLEFTHRMDRPAFLKDKLTQYASEYTIEIITWASRHVPKPMRKKYPGVDWKRCGEYAALMMPPDFHPDPRSVWKIIKTEMPLLMKGLEDIKMPPNGKRAF